MYQKVNELSCGLLILCTFVYVSGQTALCIYVYVYMCTYILCKVKHLKYSQTWSYLMCGLGFLGVDFPAAVKIPNHACVS